MWCGTERIAACRRAIVWTPPSLKLRWAGLPARSGAQRAGRQVWFIWSEWFLWFLLIRPRGKLLVVGSTMCGIEDSGEIHVECKLKGRSKGKLKGRLLREKMGEVNAWMDDGWRSIAAGHTAKVQIRSDNTNLYDAQSARGERIWRSDSSLKRSGPGFLSRLLYTWSQRRRSTSEVSDFAGADDKQTLVLKDPDQASSQTYPVHLSLMPSVCGRLWISCHGF